MKPSPQQMAPVTDRYEIGPFQLDPEASLLSRSGVPVALGRRAADLLAVLVRSPQQWMTKARLLEAAWPGLVVEEGNLAVQVLALRRVFAKVDGGEHWIETLAGRGYRFVGPVRAIQKPDAPQQFSRPTPPRNHSLPAEVSRFVGRSTALQGVLSAFSEGARVVSILGTGGVGKTRLAQRFGWMQLSRFSGGVWFCDLSVTRTVDGIATAVARGLGVQASGDDPLAYLARVISERGECLLILDNFEQVVRHAGETLVRWAERAPEARFLVTTRELLAVPGEVTLPLGPLDADDAAALFLQRATEAESDRMLEDRPAILEIARLLDFLPLAIELAAARVRVLPPRSLLERMDHLFSILPPGRGRAQRHATLRATFDWSWDLLEPNEKSALAQLSVFEGGFTVDAAEAIIDRSAFADDAPAIDLVQSLLEKSLLRRTSDHRFALLDTIKAYASDRLETDPSYGGLVATRSARARHYRYFASIDEATATAEQGVEIGNLTAACRRAVEDEDAQSATGALVRAWEVMVRTGPHRTALELAERVESLRSLSESQRAIVDWVTGTALFVLGRGSESEPRFERGLRASRASGDRQRECLLLRGLADQHALGGRIEEALNCGTEALAIAHELNDRSLQCKGLHTLAVTLWRAGRLAAAKESYTQALKLAREIRDRRMQGMLTGNLGIVNCDLRDLDEARGLYEQALQIALELGDRPGEAAQRNNLGDLMLEQGALEDARVQFEAAMTIGRFLGHLRTQLVARNGLGNVFAARGDLEGASEQYRTAAQLAQETGDRRAEGRILSRLALSLARLGASAEAQERFAAAEAILNTVDDPASLVEFYCRWAEGALLVHDPEKAAELIERAEKAALSLESPRPGHLEVMLKHVRSLTVTPSIHP